jgi:outer membrane lipoprotein SlyB
MICPRSSWVVALCSAALSIASAQAEVGRTSRLSYGEVIAAEQVMVETGHSKSGMARGATVGAIAGYVLSDGQWLGTAIGGVAGGAIGRGPSSKKGWNLVVRLKEGDEVAVQVVGKKDTYRAGDQVRLFVKDDGEVDVMKR